MFVNAGTAHLYSTSKRKAEKIFELKRIIFVKFWIIFLDLIILYGWLVFLYKLFFDQFAMR